MNHNLGKIEVKGKNVDLNSLSKKRLRDILNQINDDEIKIKQELDNILKELV